MTICRERKRNLQNTDIQDIELQETSDIWEGKYCLKSKEGLQIDKVSKTPTKEWLDRWQKWRQKEPRTLVRKVFMGAKTGGHTSGSNNFKCWGP